MASIVKRMEEDLDRYISKMPSRAELAAGLSGMWVLSQQFVCFGVKKYLDCNDIVLQNSWS